MKKLIKFRNYVITGLLIILPLVLTIEIVIWIFKILTNSIISFLPDFFKQNLLWQAVIRLVIPVIFLFFMAVIGMIAKIVFLHKIFSMTEKVFIRIPLFNRIYIALKQISYAIFNPGKSIFESVVLIEYPKKRSYALGFITSKYTAEFKKDIADEVLSIFVPTAPNPTGGNLLFIDSSDVIKLNMSVTDAMKLIISIGIISPNIGLDNSFPLKH